MNPTNNEQPAQPSPQPHGRVMYMGEHGRACVDSANVNAGFSKPVLVLPWDEEGREDVRTLLEELIWQAGLPMPYAEQVTNIILRAIAPDADTAQAGKGGK